MSMLSSQCDELREAAVRLEGYQNGEISRMLREAADTITSLWNSLTVSEAALNKAAGNWAKADAELGSGTCENANKDGYGFRFKCSECGYSTIVHNCAVRLDELPRFCPCCGREVVGEC